MDCNGAAMDCHAAWGCMGGLHGLHRHADAEFPDMRVPLFARHRVYVLAKFLASLAGWHVSVSFVAADVKSVTPD